MGKYIRLFRLQDQYLAFSSVIAAGLFAGIRNWSIFWWAIGVVLLSISAFIVNEITDRNDTDRLSWNNIHIRKNDILDKRVVLLMFITCSLVGLALSWYVGFIWWAVVIYAIALSYSLEPIRLKRRFGLDLISQIVATWMLPFFAPLWGKANVNFIAAFSIISSLAILAGMFPYQIADTQADEKAGLANTHVVLGIDRSLVSGLVLAAAAGILYLVFNMYSWATFTIPIIIQLPILLVFYGIWISLSGRGAQQIVSLQRGVKVVKFLTQMGAIYLFVLWILF
ncbi:MAG TPA: UbiA family prenyltransferase [Patescibacteria group bacterium]|nr:UbiA family prenyltransferase [Patescibacteria group bacterium]